MVKKLKNSLAYRLPIFYKKWLGHRKINQSTFKITLDISVITMTGKKLVDMTRLSMLSIVDSWDKLPKLTVVTDGTISTTELKSQLYFWPGELVITDWASTEQYHLEKDRHSLINYAKKNVLGKKMAVIFHYAELQPTVWIDSDILFYNDFTKFIPHHTGFACGGSEEGFSVYDDRILKYYNNNLYEVHRFSSGVLYMHGTDIYERFKIEDLLNTLLDYDHYFTEQTIFAHISSESLGVLWPIAIIKNFNTDVQDIKPMKKNGVVARHYTVNVRHLFWRDAFFNL
jgi:hypothetical protein